MAWRSGHGRGRGIPRIEALRPADLPGGLAVTSPTAEAERNAAGHFVAGPGTSALARRGGRAKRHSCALASKLELVPGATGADLQPYLPAARALARTLKASIAETIGGGVCPAMAGLMVVKGARLTAIEQVAIARGEYALAARLSSEARSCFMASWEIAAREAYCRPRDPHDFAAELQAAAEPRGAEK
jgi:hypothetical protein